MAIDKVEWLQRFAAKLHGVQPMIGRRAAAEAADRQWDLASDLNPEEAAALFALEASSGDPKSP